MTGALEAFTAFFGLDPDLVAAAAERSAVAISSAASAGDVRRVISAMTDREKTGMLARLFDDDPHVAAELRAAIRDRLATEIDAPPIVARTVGELRARAQTIGLARERAAAEKVAAERKRRAEDAEKAQRARLVAIARRGEGAWREVEGEIERRNAAGYDKAASLLFDLRVIADERGTAVDFARRLKSIRERHVRKEKFLERLAKIG